MFEERGFRRIPEDSEEGEAVRRMRALVAVAVLALGASCASSGDGATAEATDDGVRRSTAAVTWHMQSGKEGEVPGALATLERSSSGVEVEVRTTELEPGHTYTLWWAVVNAPEACEAHPEPCGAPDVLDNPETESQVAYGAGQVVDDGRATFTARLDAGPIPEGWFDGVGLADPLGAEVHVILNDHGPELTEHMPEMVRTYRGGCTDESLPEAFPETALADGTPGPNTCRLWQSAVFQAEG